MANIFQPSLQRVFTNDGKVASAARLYLYEAETLQPALYFLDNEGTVPGPHPLVANINGLFAPVYLDRDSSYRVTCYDSTESSVLYTVDFLTGVDQNQFSDLAVAAATEAESYRDEVRAASVYRTTLARTTLASLTALLPGVPAYPEGASGAVYQDPDTALNGIYSLTGTAFVRVAALPETAALESAEAAEESRLAAEEAEDLVSAQLPRLTSLINEFRPEALGAKTLYRTATDTQPANGFRFSSAVDVGAQYDQVSPDELVEFVDVGLDLFPATATKAEVKIYEIATNSANVNSAPPQADSKLLTTQETTSLVFVGTKRFRFVLDSPFFTKSATTLFIVWRFLNSSGVEVQTTARRHNTYSADARQRYAGYVSLTAAGALANGPLTARWLFGLGAKDKVFINQPTLVRNVARDNATRLVLNNALSPALFPAWVDSNNAGRISICGNSIHDQAAVADSSAELLGRWFPHAIIKDITAGGANNVAITAQLNSLTPQELAETVIVGAGSADFNATADNTAAIIAVFDHAWSLVSAAGGQLVVMVDYSTAAFASRHKAAELFVSEALRGKPYASRVFTFGELFAFAHSQSFIDRTALRIGQRPNSFGTDTEGNPATHLGEDMARTLATSVYIPAVTAVNGGAPMPKNILVGYEAGQAVDSLITTLSVLGNAGTTGTLQIVSGNDDDLVRLGEDSFSLTRGTGAAVDYREIRIRAANNYGETEATICLGLRHSGTVPSYPTRLSSVRRSILTRPDLALINSPQLSIFCGFRHADPENTVIGEFFNQGGNSRLRQRDGYLDLVLANATNATVLPVLSAQVPQDFSKWNLFSFSIDTGAGTTQVRTNYGPTTLGTITAGVNIRLADICRFFTHNNLGSDSVNGDLMFLWVGYSAPNLSDDSIIGKFRSLEGAAVSLGANGQTPFGVVPPICLYGREFDYQSGAASRGSIGKFPALDTVGQELWQFGL